MTPTVFDDNNDNDSHTREPDNNITYSTDKTITESLELTGFFEGWPNPPSINVFKKLLNGSYKIVLAIDNNKLVGFINAVSDGVLSAYIPLLEVLPEYRKQGTGKELVQRMQSELKHLYMVDLLCDKELIPFYESLGMTRATGTYIRNYDKQNGEQE
jgi:ribosomal protein S18 acetylase RimI-like enzyme